MQLNKIETQILLDIYEADINYKEKIKESNYELTEDNEKEKRQEFVAYLLKLKRLGYIEFNEDNTFEYAGRRSLKYKTNVYMIWTENIHIEKKGIKLVEEINRTVLEKIKGEAKDIRKKIYSEIKDWGTKAFAEYFYKITTGDK